MLETALRPGVRAGPYPERLAEALSGFDERVRQTAGFWALLPGATAHRAARFVASVEAGAAALQRLDGLALQQRLGVVRRGLLCRPFDPVLTIEAFALIREFASRTLGQRPRASQIAAGWAMLHGMVAELETGEGKSLAITLPAATAAFAGIPVHVVSVNDYLVERDAQEFLPLYSALGLTLGRITERVAAAHRRGEYAKDIAYCCNKQLVFDYLRDVASHGAARTPLQRTLAAARQRGTPMLRGLCFAIVDEADSVLIDECRTPLVLSHAARDIDGPEVYAQALRLAGTLRAGPDFELATADATVTLHAEGEAKLERLATAAGPFWQLARRRAELVRKALIALHVYRRDEHYLVRSGRIEIVDANTGRVLADRAWELGLQQMIEAKEGCALTQPRASLARITYQRFFRRYLRLGATSGTVREVARELWCVYRLRAYRVASHRPSRRLDCGRRVRATAAEQHRDVIERVRELQRQKRPVLIGTRSVGSSERLSALLSAAGVKHELLNARQDHREAQIIALAGAAGRVTIATNMAGRGTDIRLGDAVIRFGGLHVIATELNDSRRIDRQLFGRCGRQGDPGSYESVLSLEDGLVAESEMRAVVAAARRLADRYPWIGEWVGARLLAIVQRVTERRTRRVRNWLLAADRRLGEALAFTGPME